MPPTRKDIQVVDPILSRVSMKFQNMGFVGDFIFPKFQVDEVSGTYYVYGQENFDIPDVRRGIGSGYNRTTYKLTSATYACVDYGLEDIIDDRIRKTSKKKPLNLNIDTAELVAAQVLLAFEKRVVDIVTSTSLITNYVTLSGGDQWSNYTQSDPIGDIETGKNTVNAAIGKDPNTLVISEEVFRKLKHHPQILERIKYAQTGIVTEALLAAIFGIPRVKIAGALYNASKRGQDVSKSRLWGKNALLSYSEPSPGLKKISLGYNFEFEPMQTMRPFRDGNNIGDVIRTRHYVDEKLVSAPCGYLITAAVA